MSEKIPSPQSLVTQLTSFSYEQDMEFRRGISDAMTVVRNSRQCVGILDEDAKNPRKIYNEKTIIFSAEREAYDTTSKPLAPSLFTARLDIVTQIDTLPEHLLRYFDQEMIDGYEDIEPGDLNTVQSVEYTVSNINNDVGINRDLSYALRDNEEILYTISETDETNKYQLIPIPNPQRELHVARTVVEESVANAADQVQYSAIFDDMFDGITGSEFRSQQALDCQADATIAILGLIKSLRTHSKIPTID